MINYKYFLFIPLLLLPFSCDRNMVYDQYSSIGSDGWTWDDTRIFEVELTDTAQWHNIYIQIRHTADYPMSNLYMFVHVEGPSRQSLTDTVNFILAEPDGKWIGKGVGDFKELRLLYRKNTIFREPGIYRFTLEQGMRKPGLPVTDVGLRIERIIQ